MWLTILSAILKNQYDFSNTQIIALSSGYFMGVALGEFLQAIFADKVGRKNLLAICMLGALILTLAHMITESYAYFLIIRILFGIVFGTNLPLSIILCGEIIPKKIRGKTVVGLQVMLNLGIYYLFFSLYLWDVDFNSKNWRIIFLMQAIPGLICFLGTILVVKESPRFQLAKRKYAECFEQMNVMGKKNKANFEELSEDEVK